MKEWTVDTCVLAKCSETDSNDCIECLLFLGLVLKSGKLCLDHEGEIEIEYRPYIKKNPLLRRWWYMMIGQVGHISHWSNKVPNRHKNRLLNRLGFHDDDLKFVGVAARSVDKIIVSGFDSDYCPEVCQYLKKGLGITVINPNSASEM